MGAGGGVEGQGSPLLPYQSWVEAAMRNVVAQALEEAARHGLPGEHHFYITFRTGHPRASVPERLRQKYPDEMTIVLQHQYRDLIVDRQSNVMSVGLTFGGIPSTLVIPLDAISAFADPSVQFGLHFSAEMPAAAEDAAAAPGTAPAPDAAGPGDAAAEPEDAPEAAPQVVSLDAFRRRRD